MSVLAPAAPTMPRPWRRAAAWLGFLAPFFYLTYGSANWLAASRTDVPSLVFGWEHAIPFLPWTIVPYWSVNAFYGLSLFLCADRQELDTHGRRLVTAQIVAVVCFVLLPLRFSFDKPDHGGGLPGFLFDALAGFDKPFNQAPSLHIALLVILWVLYRRHCPAVLRPLLHLWFLMIGVSVLTTYQHHFIDIPTGALLGLACLWIWPDRGPSPLAGAAATRDPRRRQLAGRYAAGAMITAVAGRAIGGAGLWLMWPAVSMALVAANYYALGPGGFQKDPAGRMSLAPRLLLAPYLVAAFVSSRLWTRRDPAPVEVTPGVWLGRAPAGLDASRFAERVDVAAELPAARGARVRAFPMLDLVTPTAIELREATDAVRRAERPVLVHCALGYSRSAATIAAHLVRSGLADDAHAAVAMVRRARPGVVLSDAAVAEIGEAGRLP